MDVQDFRPDIPAIQLRFKVNEKALLYLNVSGSCLETATLHRVYIITSQLPNSDKNPTATYTLTPRFEIQIKIGREGGAANCLVIRTCFLGESITTIIPGYNVKLKSGSCLTSTNTLCHKLPPCLIIVNDFLCLTFMSLFLDCTRAWLGALPRLITLFSDCSPSSASWLKE